MRICVMPGCQTTAGCVCDRVSTRQLYHAGLQEPELVYAYKGERERLHAEINRLKALVRSMGGDPL